MVLVFIFFFVATYSTSNRIKRDRKLTTKYLLVLDDGLFLGNPKERHYNMYTFRVRLFWAAILIHLAVARQSLFATIFFIVSVHMVAIARRHFDAVTNLLLRSLGTHNT